MRLTRDFFERDTPEVARDLLGKRLIRQTEDGKTTAGIIVETEAYCGRFDEACHSYKGKTERTKVMFGPKGHAYIYLIYGMYHCLNLTSGKPGEPECVLIRALEPIEGLHHMHERRGTDKHKNLCSGPGKLAMALDTPRDLNGIDLCTGQTLYLETGIETPPVTTSPRVNIGYAGEAVGYPWRFTITGSPYVSVKVKL